MSWALESGRRLTWLHSEETEPPPVGMWSSQGEPCGYLGTPQTISQRTPTSPLLFKPHKAGDPCYPDPEAQPWCPQSPPAMQMAWLKLKGRCRGPWKQSHFLQEAVSAFSVVVLLPFPYPHGSHSLFVYLFKHPLIPPSILWCNQHSLSTYYALVTYSSEQEQGPCPCRAYCLMGKLCNWLPIKNWIRADKCYAREVPQLQGRRAFRRKEHFTQDYAVQCGNWAQPMPGETEVLIVFTVGYFKCKNSIIHMAFVNHNFIV